MRYSNAQPSVLPTGWHWFRPPNSTGHTNSRLPSFLIFQRRLSALLSIFAWAMFQNLLLAWPLLRWTLPGIIFYLRRTLFQYLNCPKRVLVLNYITSAPRRKDPSGLNIKLNSASILLHRPQVFQFAKIKRIVKNWCLYHAFKHFCSILISL